jgi:uncharacterized protein
MVREVNKDTILNFLREHKEFLHEKFGVKKIALFGSFVRGEEEEDSDIDLLIETEVEDFDNRYDLKEFLESKFNRDVDIGYFDCVRNFIKLHIQKELVYA